MSIKAVWFNSAQAQQVQQVQHAARMNAKILRRHPQALSTVQACQTELSQSELSIVRTCTMGTCNLRTVDGQRWF